MLCHCKLFLFQTLKKIKYMILIYFLDVPWIESRKISPILEKKFILSYALCHRLWSTSVYRTPVVCALLYTIYIFIVLWMRTIFLCML